MRSTALPLSVQSDGRLAQVDQFDAVIDLVGVMAGTTSTTWPHAPWFGLLDAFTEASRRERQDHETLRDAINLALRHLGVDQIKVQSVTTGAIEGGRRAFQMTLIDDRGQARFGSVRAA
jgi:hypothetical protein